MLASFLPLLLREAGQKTRHGALGRAERLLAEKKPNLQQAYKKKEREVKCRRNAAAQISVVSTVMEPNAHFIYGQRNRYGRFMRY